MCAVIFVPLAAQALLLAPHLPTTARAAHHTPVGQATLRCLVACCAASDCPVDAQTWDRLVTVANAEASSLDLLI